MLSSRGAMEVGGKEVQGQTTGQKTCKSFLVCYNEVEGIRQRRLLCNSMTRARAKCWSC